MKLLVAVVVSVLILSLITAQAFASHQEIRRKPTINVPTKGSTYALEFEGPAHIAGSDVFAPSFSKTVWTVVSVKTTGVPHFVLKLKSGFLNLGEERYALDEGLMGIRVDKVVLEATSSEQPVDLELFGSLLSPLPKNTTDEPIGLTNTKLERSATVHLIDSNWIIEFQGKVSRISTLAVEDESVIAEPEVEDLLKGNFVGGYKSDPDFDRELQPESRNLVFGVGKFSVLGRMFIDGVAISDWSQYTSKSTCADVNKELVFRKDTARAGNGMEDILVLKIDGRQCEVWEDNTYTGFNEFDGKYVILGGTGSFDGAKGSGTIEATIDTQQQTFKGRLDGAIASRSIE